MASSRFVSILGKYHAFPFPGCLPVMPSIHEKTFRKLFFFDKFSEVKSFFSDLHAIFGKFSVVLISVKIENFMQILNTLELSTSFDNLKENSPRPRRYVVRSQDGLEAETWRQRLNP